MREKYKLTVERLAEILDYDPDTGVFRWKVRPSKNSRKQPGDIAGTLQSGGYRVIAIDKTLYQATQLAFLIVNGRWARSMVRTANRVHDDTRACNLVETRTASGKHDMRTKEGKRAYSRDYWRNNSDYRQALGLRRYYRLTADQYAAMLAAQNGVCAICKQPETIKEPKTGRVKSLSVDHNHADDSVRGLLCKKCNTGLGCFCDNPQLLQTAITYLRHHAALAAPKEAA